jgi:hypothetical protein
MWHSLQAIPASDRSFVPSEGTVGSIGSGSSKDRRLWLRSTEEQAPPRRARRHPCSVNAPRASTRRPEIQDCGSSWSSALASPGLHRPPRRPRSRSLPAVWSGSSAQPPPARRSGEEVSGEEVSATCWGQPLAGATCWGRSPGARAGGAISVAHRDPSPRAAWTIARKRTPGDRPFLAVGGTGRPGRCPSATRCRRRRRRRARALHLEAGAGDRLPLGSGADPELRARLTEVCP